MKILCYCKKNGVTFHRLLMPLSKMGATFTDRLDEHLVSQFDCVWFHSTCPIHPTELSLWRLKYGFQIVVDVDDTWNIGINHPSYQGLIKRVPIRKQFAIIADYVVCSTPEIEKMIKPFNENTIVVPNRIPYGEGQYQVFQESFESFMDRKIRIGFCGSISHMEDWLSIAGKLKRVLGDDEVKKKCEFVVCGVPNVLSIGEQQWMIDKAREEMTKRRVEQTPKNLQMFVDLVRKGFVKYNTGIWNKITSTIGKPLIVGDRPVDNYIDLYREIDILLCPLTNSHLNVCKSGLKIWEAACTDTLCILGNLYRDKEEISTAHLFEDWYNNIKFLIKDKEKLYQMKTKTSEYVRGISNYMEDCVLPRQSILGKRRSIDLDITGIVYKEDQQTEYKPYFNKVKTIADKSYLFEINPILNLYQ